MTSTISSWNCRKQCRVEPLWKVCPSRLPKRATLQGTVTEYVMHWDLRIYFLLLLIIYNGRVNFVGSPSHPAYILHHHWISGNQNIAYVEEHPGRFYHIGFQEISFLQRFHALRCVSLPMCFHSYLLERVRESRCGAHKHIVRYFWYCFFNDIQYVSLLTFKHINWFDYYLNNWFFFLNISYWKVCSILTFLDNSYWNVCSILTFF